MSNPDYYWLYILMNEQNQALYVGATSNPDRRYEEHRQIQPWAAEIDGVLILPVATQEVPWAAALRAEELLIKLIKPKYNVTHNIEKILEERAEIQASADAFVFEYM